MADSMGDVMDRPTSGRFVRNLALSLSGGALLTVLGAGVAHADDGSAGTASAGTGAAQSGDATAIGNVSNTNHSAGTTPSGSVGSLQVVQQNAAVSNVGVAVANTGGNVAIGNSSTNLAGAAQVGTSSLGPATNNGKAANTSNGTATISTGDATSIGNQSNTTIQQANTGQSALGGILIVSQNALVTNSGLALANTGGNIAAGNTSLNGAGLLQGAVAGLGLASNSGTAANTSGGLATIHTGAASATGNASDTKVTQSTSGSAGGEPPGGLDLISQNAAVLNGGVGLANSGLNAAVGNTSVNAAGALQGAGVGIGAVPVVLSPIAVASNSADVSNTSDGTAAIATGDAWAVGNSSATQVDQSSDESAESGLALGIQGALVVNGGIGTANTGLNAAVGNSSLNLAGAGQAAGVGIGAVPVVLAGATTATNGLEVSNSSDGTAAIHTGDARSEGNHSATSVSQHGSGDPDGLGIVLDTQAAGVFNLGASSANSGGNLAVGNTSLNAAGAVQVAGVGVGAVPVVTALTANAANQGSVGNASDGTAAIHTGTASATGNKSDTRVEQELDSDELVLAPQIAGVVNVGTATANSGGNLAIGNISPSIAVAGQVAGVGVGAVPVVAAGNAVASNTLDLSNASDGDALIKTGDATASGNDSGTHVGQHADGSIDGFGLVIAPQAAFVLNAGTAAANSGGNVAVGNVSPSIAVAGQAALTGAGVTPVLLAQSAIASNSATVGNSSAGSATIDTGDATATGNWSRTKLEQEVDGDVDGLGLVITPQVAGVVNAGAGVSNSGLNAAVGNASLNAAGGAQVAAVGTALVPQVLVVAGPAVASNSADVSNASDGSAKVKTGDATATGNRSHTDLSQHATGDAGLGLVVAPQIAGVANVGLGVANSGLNAAVGNASLNLAGDLQVAAVASSLGGAPFQGLILGPAIASNNGSATNSSDGDACVCTGDATASGNISSTTLSQDADLSGPGVVIVPEVAGVLNAGVGVANSGLNAALGNTSTNVALGLQVGTINDGLLPLVAIGPQVVNNGGGAHNSSAGTALVASGNATGIGNESTTDLAQSATIDGGLAIAPIIGGTSNVGLGLANSGLNFGLGNDSTNIAVLAQVADGAGVVSNQGEATNDSDGTAIIGNPEDCEDEPTDEGKPGAPGLPRTGAELEVQAAIGLMLLLLGFGLQRRSRTYAFRG